MKYVIFIPDGSSDYPIDELDGMTPLMAADTPNLTLQITIQAEDLWKQAAWVLKPQIMT